MKFLPPYIAALLHRPKHGQAPGGRHRLAHTTRPRVSLRLVDGYAGNVRIPTPALLLLRELAADVVIWRRSDAS